MTHKASGIMLCGLVSVNELELSEVLLYLQFRIVNYKTVHIKHKAKNLMTNKICYKNGFYYYCP
jgi:hypothetical protein